MQPGGQGAAIPQQRQNVPQNQAMFQAQLIDDDDDRRLGGRGIRAFREKAFANLPRAAQFQPDPTLGSFGANIVNPAVFRALSMIGQPITEDLIGETKLKQETDDFSSMFVHNASQAFAGRMSVPSYRANAHSQLQDHLLDARRFNKQTPMQAPFNKLLEDPRSVREVIDNVDNEAYGVNEQTVQQTKTNAREIADALKSIHSTSFYEGVPTNTVQNKMNIDLQRARERSMYAFI